MSASLHKFVSPPRTLDLPAEAGFLPNTPEYDQLYPDELCRLLMRQGLAVPPGNPESLGWRAQAIAQLRRNALMRADLSFRHCG